MKVRGSTPVWIYSCPRPWVVIDWGVLRKQKRLQELPAGITAVISDIALLEAATNADSPQDFVDKFRSILTRPSLRGRVLFCRYWDDIAAAEAISGGPTGRFESVETDISTRWWRAQANPKLLKPLTLAEPEVQVHRLRQREFVETANQFSGWAEKDNLEGFRSLRSGQVSIEEHLRNIDMCSVLATLDHRYSEELWSARLRVWPDQLALARWMRIMFWYCLLRGQSPHASECRFANNFEDAHYLFAATYSRHLWTNDAALARAATAVSGGQIRIHREFPNGDLGGN